MSADNQTCSKRNIHGRKLKEISRVTVYIWNHRINDKFHCAFRPAVVGKLLTSFRLHNDYTFVLRRLVVISWDWLKLLFLSTDTSCSWSETQFSMESFTFSEVVHFCLFFVRCLITGRQHHVIWCAWTFVLYCRMLLLKRWESLCLLKSQIMEMWLYWKYEAEKSIVITGQVYLAV